MGQQKARHAAARSALPDEGIGGEHAFGAAPLRLPWSGPSVTAKEIGSPSGSEPVRATATEASSGVATDCVSAVGAWFMRVIVISTAAEAGSACPSLTLKVKLSGPW